MNKKPVKADKMKDRRRFSFGKILGELKLTERAAAELLGVTYSRINNILRGNSSVDDELALQIQAMTGISAASLLKGENPPLMLNGKPICQKLLQAWKDKPVSEENKRSQVNEIGFMCALLLEAAGAKGDHLRRRTYHLIRSLIEEVRQSSGISFAEINETARMGASYSEYHATRDQLDEEIGEAPLYQAIRELLPARGVIPVKEEAFPVWCDLAEFADQLPEVSDRLEVTRRIYRLQIGEQWHLVIKDRLSCGGIISPRRERKLMKSFDQQSPKKGPPGSP